MRLILGVFGVVGSLFSSSDNPFTTSGARVTLRLSDDGVLGVKINVDGVVGVANDADGAADVVITVDGVEMFSSEGDRGDLSLVRD